MAEHEPVDEPESRFLEHEKDLMALKRKASLPATPPSNTPPPDHRQEKLVLIAALLIPPIAIALVSGLLAKVVIMAILAFTGFVILESQPTTLSSLDIGERRETASVRKKEINLEQCKPPSPFPLPLIQLI